MSDLPWLALMLAAQIAAVSIVALSLDRWLAGHCPATAARVLLAALMALPMLTALAFVPLPDW